MSNSFTQAFAQTIYEGRYKHPDDADWKDTSLRVTSAVVGALYSAPKAQALLGEIDRVADTNYDLMREHKWFPGGRYLYAAGRDLHQVNNCVLLRCPDDREGWATTSYQAEMALMTGAGIGVWYGDVRAAGQPIRRTGGEASGPIPKMEQVNDTGRHIMQGGQRRSAIWAGLPWWHADIFEFIKVKDWDDDLRELKSKRMDEGKDLALPMDKTNISVTLDDDFFHAHEHLQPTLPGTAPDGRSWHEWAVRVYETAVAHMLRCGEPGFTIDTGPYAGEVLRNACTEITSAHDSDVCNLGSLVLPRFESPKEFGAAVRNSVAFLTAGSMYSDVPYKKVAEVRELNRRLGLGLMGVHEFVMRAGTKYGTDGAFEVLEPYMMEFGRALEYANDFQEMLDISLSIGATAIAPNGTIGMLAETTPSTDPMFSSAELRTVHKANALAADERIQHVVVDPTAARLVSEGVHPSLIEDAYQLAYDPERRLAQQAYLQEFTDHAISSTVNLPVPILNPEHAREFGDTLMKYLPHLRGITAYPDGAIPGQPRKPVDLAWAMENEGTIFEGHESECIGGLCGV